MLRIEKMDLHKLEKAWWVSFFGCKRGESSLGFFGAKMLPRRSHENGKENGKETMLRKCSFFVKCSFAGRGSFLQMCFSLLDVGVFLE